MKTFKDLEFKPHPFGEGKQAKMFFPNGYGISVVRFKISDMGSRNGYGSHTINENQWEVAVLFGNEKDWSITYNTPITEDVIGYCTGGDVTEIMEKIQLLS